MIAAPYLLSLCMIVKNESQNLHRCLDSVRSQVDELVIVDTGSEDNTPEIAQQYGAKLSYFSWCDDFAAARNFAISQARGQWILMLDADEELLIQTSDFRQTLSESTQVLAYSLDLKDALNQQGLTVLRIMRLFRNLPELRYVGRYHERLHYQHRDIPANLTGHLESLEILHYGYHKDTLKQKSLIRLPILEQIHKQEGLSLMLLWTLSGMYECTQQWDQAQECYAEAFERLLPHLLAGNPPDDSRSVPSWLYSLGLRSLQEQDYETTRLISQCGLNWFDNYPPLSYLTGLLVKSLGFSLGAIPYFQRCLQFNQKGNYLKGEPFDRTLITTCPAYELGCLYLNMQQWPNAVTAFDQVLAFEPTHPVAKAHLIEAKQKLAALNT